MRLKLNEKLHKNYFLYSFALVVFSAACLYCLSLRSEAASSSGPGSNMVTEYPLYYGFGSGYGYPAGVDVSSVVSSAIQYAGTSLWYGHTPYAVFAYEYNSNSGIFTVCCVYEGSVNFSPNPQSFPSIVAGDTLTYGRTVQYFIDVNVSTLACSWNRNVSFNSVSPYTWLSSTPTGGFYIPQDVLLYGYPLWIDGNIDIYSAGDRLGFIYGVPSSGGHITSISGGGIGSLIPDSSTGGYNIGFDINIDTSDITDHLQVIEDNQDDIKSSIDDMGQSLGDISGKMGVITDQLDYQNGVPSSQTYLDVLQGSGTFGGLIETTQSVTSIGKDLFGSPGTITSSDMNFDFDFHYSTYNYNTSSFVDNVQSVHISFDWHESIRNKVVTVIIVFMSLGFLMYLFRQIPNLINGVSGGASAGQSIADSFQTKDIKGKGGK